MSFLAELKRRNVIRMAGLYLVGAWLLIQIAETLLPIFGVPEWVLRAIVILLALGFLPTLVFSWVFELTPEGLKRDGGVAADASVAAQTGRRMEKLILGGMVLVVLLIAADRLWPRSAPEPDVVIAPTEATGTEVSRAATRGEPVSATAASIAVLPFENMSADVENGFFADGISEELLNVLAGIEGLTVASRTSSFTFKDTNTPVPEIARQLGVQHVLEGSVRKQGDRVRITAQLIHAATDAHLWSETYDRDLSDIFKVQEEIAQAISDELVGLLPVASKVSVAASTADLEAYERFLRGRSRFHQRQELPEGLADLQFAVERDPELGEAWVFLAATQYVLPGYDFSFSLADAAADSAESMAQARRLEPGHPLVHALEGVLQSRGKGYLAGIDKLAYAASLRSTDSTPLLWYGLAQLQAGYIEQAVATLERATSMDPLSGIANGYLGIALLSAGEQARGAEAVQRATELGWVTGTGVYAIELARRGDRDQALALVRQIPTLPDTEFARATLP
jgi:TolB-like protein